MPTLSTPSLRTQLYQAFHNKMFLITMALMCLLSLCAVYLIVSSRAESLQLWSEFRFDEQGNPLVTPDIPAGSLYCKWLGGDATKFTTAAFYLVAFLACSIPFSWSLLSERKSGYDGQMVLRCGRLRYYSAKYAAAFLSGAAVVAVPLLLNFVLTACFIPAFTPEPYAELYYGLTTTYLWNGLFFQHPVLYVLLYILLAGVMAGAWATLGVSLSFFCRNQFQTIILPYLSLLFFHVLWNHMLSNALRCPVQLSPIYFIVPRELKSSNHPLVIVGWLAAIALVNLLVVWRKGWRTDVL